MKEYLFSYEKINSHLGESEKFKHSFNPDFEILPFVTRTNDRYGFDRGAIGIVGEYFRYLLKTNHDDNILELIDKTIDGPLFATLAEEQKAELKYIIRKSLFDEEGGLKVLDAGFFQYLDFSSPIAKKKVHEKKIAEFLGMIFQPDDEDLAGLLTNTKYQIIKKIFHAAMNGERQVSEKNTVNLFPNLTALFKEDFAFLANSQEKFTKSFDLLLMHYFHVYIVQTCVQLQHVNRKNTIMYPLYYTYETEENVRKSRKCVTSGYKIVDSFRENLYAEVQLLNHLNYTNEDNFYGTRAEITNQTISRDTLEQWQKWIVKYSELNNLTFTPDEQQIVNQGDFTQLTDLHYANIKKEYSKKNKQGTESRYVLTIEEIAKQYFLKTRGPLGYVYTITPDFLNVLMAVCVKEEKIHVSQLFDEFEKRGICTDRETRQKIITVLDELDLLIKKSDGGEAQYVKAIL